MNANILGSDQIDKITLEIAQAEEQTYSDVQELAEDLPDHAPRFILLSYPLELVRRLLNSIMIMALLTCAHH